MLTTIFFLLIIGLILYILKNYRNKPEFLLLLPVILSSNFFGFVESNQISLVGFADTKDLTFLLIFLIYIHFVNTKSIQVKYFNTNYISIYASYNIYLLLMLIVSILLYNELLSSLSLYKFFLRYLAFFLYIKILQRLNDKQIYSFFSLLKVVTIILVTLYLLQTGLGIQIFAIKPHILEQYYSIDIERNFGIVPEFATFFLLYFILREKYSIWTIFITFMLFLIPFFNYTRHSIVGYIFLIIFTIIIRIITYHRSRQKNSLYIVYLSLFFFIGFVILVSKFSHQYDYLSNRFESITSSGGVSKEGNMAGRLETIGARTTAVTEKSFIFGLGFLKNDMSKLHFPELSSGSFARKGNFLLGDQSWATQITVTGIIGAIWLIFLLLVLPIKVFKTWYQYVRFHGVKYFPHSLHIILIFSILIIYSLFYGSFFSELFILNGLSISFQLAIVFRFIFNKIKYSDTTYINN